MASEKTCLGVRSSFSREHARLLSRQTHARLEPGCGPFFIVWVGAEACGGSSPLLRTLQRPTDLAPCVRHMKLSTVKRISRLRG